MAIIRTNMRGVLSRPVLSFSVREPDAPWSLRSTSQFPAVRTKRRLGVIRAEREEVLLTQSPQCSERIEYSDSWLERRAIWFLTSGLEQVSGKKTKLEGYEGLVDITRKLVQGIPVTKQREKVLQLLHIVLPGWLCFIFKMVPKPKSVKELCALFTIFMFKWLIGESEIREREVHGEMMKSTVHIKKCRFLENSRCVGLCVNLCKYPTQDFIGKQFGLPLTMKPNFDDMSCEMIFGLEPQLTEEDEAYSQPCYSLCNASKGKHHCA